MLELFVFGTIWFWLLLIVELVVLLAFIEYEQNALCAASLVFVGLAMWFCGSGKEACMFLYANPFYSIPAIFIYFFIGALCALLLWYLYVTEINERKEKRKIEFFNVDLPNRRKLVEKCASSEKNDKELADIAASLEQKKMIGTVKETWEAVTKQAYYDKWGRPCTLQKPIRSKNKGRIMGWICYWPPVVLWRLIHDPIRSLGNFTYRLITDCLDRITDSAWSAD